MKGSIRIYIGCMYSGKTSEIIKEYHRQHSIDKKVLCINYKGDTRYGADDFLYNHDSTKYRV